MGKIAYKNAGGKKNVTGKSPWVVEAEN